MVGGRGRSRPAEGYFTELPADDKKDAAASAIEEEEEEDDEEATVDGSDVDEETEDLEELDGEEEEEAEDLTSSSGRGRGKKRGRPLGSKGKKKKIEKLPGAPDRPQNAYMLYLADYRRTHAETISKIPAKEVSKIVGERWKALTEEEKAMYEERAEKESEAYQVALAEFKEENPHFQRKKRRKRHPGEPIKKTAFLFFMEDFTPQFKLQHPEIKTHLASELMKLGGEAWKSMPIPSKQLYIQKSEQRKQEYDQWLNSGGSQLIEGMEQEEAKMEKEVEKARALKDKKGFREHTVFDFQGVGLDAAPNAATATRVHASAFVEQEQRGETSLHPQKQRVLEENQQKRPRQQPQEEDRFASLPAPPPAEQLLQLQNEDLARQRQATELRFEHALQSAGFSLNDLEVKKVIAAAAAAAMAQQHGTKQQQQRQVATTLTPTALPPPPPPPPFRSSSSIDVGSAAGAPLATALHPGLPPLPQSMRPSTRFETAPTAAQPSLFPSHVVENQSNVPQQPHAAPMPGFTHPSTAAGPAGVFSGRLLPAPPLEVDLQRQQSFAQRIQTQIEQELAKLRNFMLLPASPQQQQQQQAPAVEAGVPSVPLVFPGQQPVAPVAGGLATGSSGRPEEHLQAIQQLKDELQQLQQQHAELGLQPVSSLPQQHVPSFPTCAPVAAAVVPLPQGLQAQHASQVSGIIPLHVLLQQLGHHIQPHVMQHVSEGERQEFQQNQMILLQVMQNTEQQQQQEQQEQQLEGTAAAFPILEASLPAFGGCNPCPSLPAAAAAAAFAPGGAFQNANLSVPPPLPFPTTNPTTTTTTMTAPRFITANPHFAAAPAQIQASLPPIPDDSSLQGQVQQLQQLPQPPP